MSYSGIRLAIATRIEASLSAVTLRAENEKRENPQDVTWARWSIRPIDSRIVTAHALNGDEETVGALWFQIFTPEGEGTKPAHDLADLIKSAFNQKKITNNWRGRALF